MTDKEVQELTGSTLRRAIWSKQVVHYLPGMFLI